MHDDALGVLATRLAEVVHHVVAYHEYVAIRVVVAHDLLTHQIDQHRCNVRIRCEQAESFVDDLVSRNVLLLQLRTYEVLDRGPVVYLHGHLPAGRQGDAVVP